ncbi:trypsin-like serine protease [Mangrovimicrobium sediminis]|uniref:Trypsin-like serine protease n=1 Tax=Mangrovimicrobium sediminis TaxID=2562682 RepID=A0A4Z0M1V6_9GAMM|nr:trypsin-like serine protease [Haliea sp. SAOS-164]TGD73509.1 trypsin-like serine protease [Haliea sp. SAOS-164]
MKPIHNPLARSAAALGLAAAATAAPLASADGYVRMDIPARQSLLTEQLGLIAEQTRLPMVTAAQLPEGVRARLGQGNGEVASLAFGTGGIPFTTRKASTETGSHKTIRFMPYAPTGKLWMQFGVSYFVCTASIIDKGLLVTAAHCITDFGEGNSPDAVWFEPNRHKGATFYGTFTVSAIFVPPTYLDGTDVCNPGAVGIVCENDLAVLVTDSNGGEVADVVGGYYGTAVNNYSYVSNFPATGRTATQITQLGYPVSLHAGKQMIRTDSLGEQDDYNNVIIGTDQTGGSSGGPWLANFGSSITNRDATENPEPSDNQDNVVIGTTSWGYLDGSIKIGGASRFGNNTAYPTTTNIDSLHNGACSEFPSKCY